MAWSKLVSMELSDEDKLDAIEAVPSIKDQPDFPYGLRICLTQKELDKLGIEADCDIGDYIDLRAFARVTSVSQNEVNGEQQCRVELQIEQLAVENETDETGEGDE